MGARLGGVDSRSDLCVVAGVTATIFAPAQLAEIVTTLLPQLPAGHTSAVVSGVDLDGLYVVARFKLRDDHWSVTAAARKRWTGETEAGATVLLSW
jgi:hypothetical protein